MSTRGESSCNYWQFHLPSDQQQPDPLSWPSSASPTSTTNIFHVCTRHILLRHSSVPFSSPVHKPTNLTVHIPRYSHANPSTRHHVNPSPSRPHPQNDYSTLSQFERPVWIHLSSCRDISDDSTIVTKTVLTGTVCAVSHNYSYHRQPALILCQRITSSNGNILIVCRLHLILHRFCAEFCKHYGTGQFVYHQPNCWTSTSVFPRHGKHFSILKSR